MDCQHLIEERLYKTCNVDFHRGKLAVSVLVRCVCCGKGGGGGGGLEGQL